MRNAFFADNFFIERQIHKNEIGTNANFQLQII